MSSTPFIALEATSSKATKTASRSTLEQLGFLYARIALGAAFLSAVASRFGVWDGKVGWDHFAKFTQYTAAVNSFMPVSISPFLAWAATAAELSLGLALIIGFRLRWVAFGSSILLALFATAMAISFGLKEPLDYSVYSASAAALLLALQRDRKSATKS
jgi:putative oxidoreductase